jgi:hypothetical protein
VRPTCLAPDRTAGSRQELGKQNFKRFPMTDIFFFKIPNRANELFVEPLSTWEPRDFRCPWSQGLVLLDLLLSFFSLTEGFVSSYLSFSILGRPLGKFRTEGNSKLPKELSIWTTILSYTSKSLKVPS